jgi:hypothetical protein
MTDSQHDNKIDRDGPKDDYDHSTTKDVSESGGGRHDEEDKGGK